MIEEENLDEESLILQESIISLINTNREFLRLLSVVVQGTNFKSRSFNLELKTAYDDFVKARQSLETIHAFEDHITQ